MGKDNWIWKLAPKTQQGSCAMDKSYPKLGTPSKQAKAYALGFPRPKKV